MDQFQSYSGLLGFSLGKQGISINKCVACYCATALKLAAGNITIYNLIVSEGREPWTGSSDSGSEESSRTASTACLQTVSRLTF